MKREKLQQTPVKPRKSLGIFFWKLIFFNKLGNLEIDKLLKTYDLPRSKEEDANNIDRPIARANTDVTQTVP